MPDLKLIADVFSPNHIKTLKYTGDQPSRVFKIIPSIMKNTFRITSTNFYEDDIKWDVSSPEKTTFYAQWRGKDNKDGRTAIWIKIKAIGEQHPKDKKGNVTIYIHPYMITNLPYSNFFWKSLAFTYSRLFYGNQRRKYIVKELLLLSRLEEQIKAELGIR